MNDAFYLRTNKKEQKSKSKSKKQNQKKGKRRKRRTVKTQIVVREFFLSISVVENSIKKKGVNIAKNKNDVSLSKTTIGKISQYLEKSSNDQIRAISATDSFSITATTASDHCYYRHNNVVKVPFQIHGFARI